MFRTYFKVAWRNLLKYRSYSIINMVGLSLGLSGIMVLAFMLYQFITVNSQFQNKDRMYYIKAKSPEGKLYKQTPFPFLDELIKTCPDIEAATHIQSWSWPWLKNGDKEFQESTWYVDSAFLKVFTYPLEYGNASVALLDKRSVVISHEMAEKLFGKENAIGKTITADDSTRLLVTGVLKTIPSNTTLRPEVLLSTALLKDNKDFVESANWYNSFAENYLLLSPGTDIAKMNRQLNQLAQTFFHPEKRQTQLVLTPYKNFVENEAGDIVQVIIKGITGTIAFVLLILIANLINLNAATLFSRAKEVAVKKMMGSSKRQVITQFCVENGLLVFASLCIAFILFITVLLPQVNSLAESKFGAILPDINHDYPLALWFIAGGLVIVIIAGSYPAFHLTSLKVTDVIKGKVSVGDKKQYARNTFITIQFVLAITFIGVTFILGRQINHMKSAALGFNKEDVLVVPMNLAYKNAESATAQFDALLNKLRSNPYVKSVATSNVIPTAYQNNFNIFYNASANKEVSIRHAVTDAGLIPTYEIALTEGRNFNNVPRSNEQNNVIINTTAMKAFGWDHAVGKQIKPRGSDETLTVVGVMEDFHYLDLTRNVEPLLHYYGDQQKLGYTYMSIRIDPRHINAIVKQVRDGFAAIPSRRPFSYELMNSRIDKQYALLNSILKVTGYVSLLTILIAGMGLFGLVASFARQRVKEIGIRKVLGASVADIVRMLSGNYAMLIVVASVIATPLVWLIMNRWMQDFAYRVNVSLWMPLVAGLAALIIALSIVVVQSVKTALANPVKSLRSE